jgi:hypothetical protein
MRSNVRGSRNSLRRKFHHEAREGREVRKLIKSFSFLFVIFAPFVVTDFLV